MTPLPGHPRRLAAKPGIFQSVWGAVLFAALVVVSVLAWAFVLGVVARGAAEFFELGWGLL